MADRGRVKHTAEIAAADLANLLRREPLLHHLFHDCVVESDLLVRPGFVRPPTAAPSSAAGAPAGTGTTRATAGSAKSIRSSKPVGPAARSAWSTGSAAGLAEGSRRREFRVSADTDVVNSHSIGHGSHGLDILGW